MKMLGIMICVAMAITISVNQGLLKRKVVHLVSKKPLSSKFKADYIYI